MHNLTILLKMLQISNIWKISKEPKLHSRIYYEKIELLTTQLRTCRFLELNPGKLRL
jgi:hypothetical protein